MKDEEIDSLFEIAPEMPAALEETIRAQIMRDTRPVKPLVSGAALGVLFMALAAIISLLFAAIFKFKGVQALSVQTLLEFLLALILAAVLAATMVARGMRPAAGRLHSWLIGAVVLVAYEGLVVLSFHDYSMGLFAQQGVLCFALGTGCGLLVALPVWFVVRQGFVVQPIRAGAAIGLLGGLAGMTFLTLHCAVLEVPHAAVWHAAVLVTCAAAGGLGGRFKRGSNAVDGSPRKS